MCLRGVFFSPHLPPTGWLVCWSAERHSSVTLIIQLSRLSCLHFLCLWIKLSLENTVLSLEWTGDWFLSIFRLVAILDQSGPLKTQIWLHHSLKSNRAHYFSSYVITRQPRPAQCFCLHLSGTSSTPAYIQSVTWGELAFLHAVFVWTLLSL